MIETPYDDFETQEMIDAVRDGASANPEKVTILYKDGVSEVYTNIKIKKWDHPKGFYSIMATGPDGTFALHRIAISEIRKVTLVY